MSLYNLLFLITILITLVWPTESVQTITSDVREKTAPTYLFSERPRHSRSLSRRLRVSRQTVDEERYPSLTSTQQVLVSDKLDENCHIQSDIELGSFTLLPWFVTFTVVITLIYISVTVIKQLSKVRPTRHVIHIQDVADETYRHVILEDVAEPERLSLMTRKYMLTLIHSLTHTRYAYYMCLIILYGIDIVQTLTRHVIQMDVARYGTFYLHYSNTKPYLSLLHLYTVIMLNVTTYAEMIQIILITDLVSRTCTQFTSRLVILLPIVTTVVSTTLTYVVDSSWLDGITIITTIYGIYLLFVLSMRYLTSKRMNPKFEITNTLSPMSMSTLLNRQ